MCLLCTIQQMAVGTIKRFLRRRRQARIFKLMAREARSPNLFIPVRIRQPIATGNWESRRSDGKFKS
jgi:hypothetical protein